MYGQIFYLYLCLHLRITAFASNDLNASPVLQVVSVFSAIVLYNSIKPT